MFAGITFILTFFQYESPRFLIKKGKPEEALENMAKIRNLPVDDPYVLREINAIQMAYEEELEATMGANWLGVVKELLFVPSNAYRLWLSAMVQFLSQWSGAGSITLYAPDFFDMLGIRGQNEALLISGVFGIVKLVAAVCCALFLVDVIGRKRALLIGITCQAISMIYVASFLTAVPGLTGQDDYHLRETELRASRGAIAMIYLSGFGWALGMFSLFPSGLRQDYSRCTTLSREIKRCLVTILYRNPIPRSHSLAPRHFLYAQVNTNSIPTFLQAGTACSTS